MNDLEMNFPVDKLIKILEKNRNDHIKIVKEAKEAYRLALTAELKKFLEECERGNIVELKTDLRLPGDFRSSYENAISMLKLTTDKVIKLGSNEFAAYVRDKWHWQKGFLDIALYNARTVSGSLGTGGHYYLSSATSKYNELYSND